MNLRFWNGGAHSRRPSDAGSLTPDTFPTRGVTIVLLGGEYGLHGASTFLRTIARTHAHAEYRSTSSTVGTPIVSAHMFARTLTLPFQEPSFIVQDVPMAHFDEEDPSADFATATSLKTYRGFAEFGHDIMYATTLGLAPDDLGTSVPWEEAADRYVLFLDTTAGRGWPNSLRDALRKDAPNVADVDYLREEEGTWVLWTPGVGVEGPANSLNKHWRYL